MASALSYELFQAKQGAADGLATLDGSGKLQSGQLPEEAISCYKGEFADEAALVAAHPTAELGDYAYVTASTSYWYWNSVLAVAAWVNQQITETAYLALSAAERAAVPYVVISN